MTRAASSARPLGLLTLSLAAIGAACASREPRPLREPVPTSHETVHPAGDGSALGPAGAEAATYVDADGVFSIRFPTRPSVATTRERMANGEMITTTASASSQERIFMALKLVMTNVDGYDCTKGLDGMRDHSLANMGCESTAENPASLRGRPGREILFSCAQRRMKGAMLVYCDDRSLTRSREVTTLEVISAYPFASNSESPARAFLTSFELR